MNTIGYTPQDLHAILKSLRGEEDKKDITQYRYIIYARKSSEDEERQVRSLGDQVIECSKLAENKNLKIAGTSIKESVSAKEPDIRPKFRQMLEDIKKGKYEGIIAWHPDRLARNMKDAGEIIDLLDKQIIKDLQFVSFTFENNTAGKMLLGISFVLSKQYSDKLSDDVRRGIRRSIEEGKYLSKAKHGYYKDRNQMLRPDGNNFTLMRNAWNMRLLNKTLDEIAQYLNRQGYYRAEGIGAITHKLFKMDKRELSEIFRDTFYTGVLVYGENTPVNLNEIYDFTPVVTVDEFLQINQVSDIRKVIKAKFRGVKEGTVKADFLRGRIICGHCGRPMTSGVTPKRNKQGVTNYYYYRCDTHGCKISKSSGKLVKQNVRAKIVLDFVYKYLEENRFTHREVYRHYIQEMEKVREKQQKELENRRKSLQQTKRQIEERIEKTKRLILDETDTQIQSIFKQDLKKIEQELQTILDSLEQVRIAIEKNKQAVITYEGFLELFNNLPAILRKTKTITDKDSIIRKIFLNFTLKEWNVASYQLNSPFKEFVEKGFVVSSRGAGN